LRAGLALWLAAAAAGSVVACNAEHDPSGAVRRPAAAPALGRSLVSRAHAATTRTRLPALQKQPPQLRIPASVHGVYAAAASGRLAAVVAGIRPRVYVPNSGDGTVDVIDPRTYRVVASYPVGATPQHISPSWDLRHLYVGNNAGNSLTELSPRTGRRVRTIPVADPYNLYFTPAGDRAIVVAERDHRLDFRNPHTWKLIRSVPIPYDGVDHLDFSADGRYLLVSAEFSGWVVRVSTTSPRVTGKVRVGGLPIDVKLSPDGRNFYVANQGRGGVSILSPHPLREVRFLHTGAGAHGLAFSRDTRSLYVTNRLGGSISVIDVKSRYVRKTWRVGGSPDMLQVSPDGRRLWVSNRYSGSVSVINTRTGRVVKRIPVGAGPHGLTYFPQPGRFSIGHNGVYR
jgi:YVTN family beta-propeller protein